MPQKIATACLMGAAHGIGRKQGLPVKYLLRRKDSARLWQHCQTLTVLA